jgi:membrane-associated phospholipid phosphatase
MPPEQGSHPSVGRLAPTIRGTIVECHDCSCVDSRHQPAHGRFFANAHRSCWASVCPDPFSRSPFNVLSSSPPSRFRFFTRRLRASAHTGRHLQTTHSFIIMSNGAASRAPPHVSTASPASSPSPSGASSSNGAHAFLKELAKHALKAQWIVGGGCVIVAISYPHVEVYGFLAGAFLNVFISKGLKRLIAQDRPMYAMQKQAGTAAAAGQAVKGAASGVIASAVDAAFFAADELGVSHPSPRHVLGALPVPQPDLGHGMPSSHAMSLFYFATYLALASKAIVFSPAHYSSSSASSSSSGALQAAPHPVILLLRRILPDWMEESWDDGVGRYVCIGVVYALVSVECYTRIRRRYHTWQQIVVGACLGSLYGFVHHRFVMPVVREQSKDVPPLAERSNTFMVCVTVGMTALAAIVLGPPGETREQVQLPWRCRSLIHVCCCLSAQNATPSAWRSACSPADGSGCVAAAEASRRSDRACIRKIHR